LIVLRKKLVEILKTSFFNVPGYTNYNHHRVYKIFLSHPLGILWRRHRVPAEDLKNLGRQK
jgi:hypothetical protein